MSRQLWLDPGFGASGDMVLGALLGLGAPVEEIRHQLAGLDVDGWTITVGPTDRASISATRATVTTTEGHAHRAWSTIDALLAGADLPPPVAAGARATFERLGRAEAAIHQIELDAVHFHEVGAVDAIVDIVGAWAALHLLAVDRVVVGPIGLGHGRVEAAHGVLPIPAPATLALLEGAAVHPVESPTETVTPTGAALLVSMADDWGPIPTGRISASARGAGGRNPDTHPNVITAVMVESDHPITVAEDSAGAPTSTMATVLATNVDDVTAEVIGHTMGQILEAGADDVWVVPALMKKNRPGHELRVLCSPALAAELSQLVLALTGSLGIRAETVTKHALARSWRTAELRGHPVRLKVGPYGAKAEHDDLVTVSEATGVPIRQLAREMAAIEYVDRM